MIFYAKRVLDWTGGVSNDVSMSPNRATLAWDDQEFKRGTDVCLYGFRKAFGFTPRKGKTYKITVREADVEEIS